MHDSTTFLTGGGQLGALMRTHDWSTSPLGSPDTWPPSLRTVVDLLLQSRFPMFVAWGPDLGFLYNDSYAEILGAKHPSALGRRFADIWSEIWPDISPLIDAAMSGQATYREDLPLILNRKGYDEAAWFTFSYSPVRDETGTVAGMFCAVSETTEKVVAERALRKSEGRLRALVAASSYALYRMSPDWSQGRVSRDARARAAQPARADPDRAGTDPRRRQHARGRRAGPEHAGASGCAHGAAHRRPARRVADHVRQNPAAA
jgi:PAS domain-containing protein